MSGTEASDAALPIEYAVPEDGNEEMCGACRAGGILLCCEACPAAYHAPCAGYGAPLPNPTPLIPLPSHPHFRETPSVVI